MKKSIFILCSSLSLLVLTACERNCNCNCNCNVTELEIEATAEPTSEPDKIEVGEDEDEIEFEDSDDDFEFEFDDDAKSDSEDEEKLYQKVKKKYLNTDWDGSPIKMGSHTVSIAERSGYALADGYLIGDQENFDVPDNIMYSGEDKGYSNDACYIPGKGTYLIRNKVLVKYLKRKCISLPGGALKWKGSKSNYNQPVLHYFKTSDQLFMITFSAGDKWPEVREWLYVFEDYNKSEIKFLGELIRFEGSSEDEIPATDFVYKDKKGVSWRYNGKTFEKE